VQEKCNCPLRYKTFGWNGFTFDIPSDMYLSVEGGNAMSGYMRLEAEKYFLDVKWEGQKPKKVKPLEEVILSLIKQLEKDGEAKLTVQGKRPTHIFEHDALLYNINSGLEERMYVWYCEESLRVIIFRFAFMSLDNAARAIIRRVLSSFGCHGEEMNYWRILESSFKAPPSFLLSERKMMVGRTYLLLVEEEIKPFPPVEKRREILFEYFTMANVRFEEDHKDIERWMEKNYLKGLKKRYHLKFKSSDKRELNNHPVIIQKGGGGRGFLTRMASVYTNASWYCDDLNTIYSVTVSEHITKPLPMKRQIDEEAFEGFAEEVISSTKCH